jgi:cytochrome P450
VCIGASFAMIEAVVILATFVRALRLFPVAGHKPKPVARVTLRGPHACCALPRDDGCGNAGSR